MGVLAKDPSPPGTLLDGSNNVTTLGWNRIIDRVGGENSPTANRVAKTDANGDFVTSIVTNTELDFLSGVTSAIQTQLNGKAASSHVHAGSDITTGTIADVRLSSNVPFKDASNVFTNDNEFNNLILNDQDGTPVADREFRVIDGKVLVADIAEIEGRYIKKESLEQLSAAELLDDIITNAKLANVATSTVKGRITAGSGDPEDLTVAQLTTLVDIFTSTLKGAVPGSGGGSTNFLRADGVWAAPPGAGGGEANTASNVGVGGVGVFKQKTGVDLEFKNINAGSGAISVTNDVTNSEVDIDVTDAGITYAKIQNVSATDRILGRDSVGAGVIEEITPANLRTMINVADGANNYTHPNHSGDVTSVGDGAQTIVNNVVSDAKLRDSVAVSIIGRSAGTSGDPADIVASADAQFLSRHSGTLSFAAIVAADLPTHNHAGVDINSGTINLARLPVGTAFQRLRTNFGVTALEFFDDILTLTFVIDGGGATITTGIKGDLEIPFDCEIQQATLLADQTGSIVVDIWKDTYANYPPTVADTITAAAKLIISSAVKSQDATLTGWTKTISVGDILRFNVDSVTSIQRVTLSLKVRKK